MAEGENFGRISGVDDVPLPLLPEGSRSASLAEGENINQQIINSSVNAVAGDKIHNTINNYNMNSGIEAIPTDQPALIQGTGGDVHFTMRDQAKLKFVVEQRTSYRKAVTIRKLIQAINEKTKEVTDIDVLQDFQNEELQKPDFEVYPQMRQVDVSDYYKGRYENSRLPFTDRSEWHHKQFSQFGHNQLTKEIGFIRQGEVSGKTIDVDEVMASVWQREILDSSKSVGTTAIVASAGSGKSTLTRRIARHALSMSTAREEVEDMHSSDLQMVHFVELKDIEETGKIKPSKFLFGGLYPNEEDEEEAFKWLDEHQSDVILIFDGLDQARWHFDEKSLRKIKKYEAASSWTIMHNILARNILRHVKVYIASREFAVSELPAMARPKTIITLNGLTLKDAYRLFVFLLKEKGEELWQKIQSMSPRLLNLVSVPVFLILTAVVMGRDPSKPPPKTITELYNRIILALQSVENIRNRDQILSIVNKLKALAFQGMKEGRVVFKETELTRFGVSAVEVQDLMTKVPGNNLLSQHLVQGDFTFFFSHQSLQEYLAAIFITEMEFNEFSRFDEEHLHGERWSVVRRFVAGVVFSKSQNDLYEVSDRTDKQQILKLSIRLQLAKIRDKSFFMRNKIMELYTVMYESGDDALMKQHSAINESHISLSCDEAHVVGSLAARNKRLDSLKLVACSIDDELLGIIARCLENRIHVKEVDLRYNKLSATALRSLLRHRRIESLSGKLDWEVVNLTVDGWDVELKNEEDVIKINGRRNEGSFDFKDSTLSFKMVVSVAAKYVSDLFDAKFTKLIEELFVQEDGLRELSEYRIEKLKKVDLRGNKVPATVLRSFLEHRQIESLSGKLDWEVVKLTVDGEDVELKNEEDAIKRSGPEVGGHFDFKDSSLSFKKVSVVALEYVSDLFDATFVKLIEKLFAQEVGLRKISEYGIEKLKEVDLRGNVSATALRSLLGHRRIGSLSGKLDWEVVKLTVDGEDVELKNEEDAIKISGPEVGGHFDFKDSSLSFKTVSAVALKYVSDLFDATFVKLIEKLVAQEVGLRKISEYRIEKVKELDWRKNKVPATALRSFLGHRRIESLSGNVDWEVVKLTVPHGSDVELKNDEDVIKMRGRNVTGHFNIKESTLSFKMVISVAEVEFLINLFNAEFVKLIEELHVKQAGLRDLSEYKVKKISKIVLDCTEEDIDWSMIETCWEKYQLDLLGIAVNGQIPVDDNKLILERGKAISVPLHIHAMFYVEKADEFRKTLEDCQQKKIEYIRCIFQNGCRPSPNEISYLVNNSNLKKVTLIYYEEDDMLKGNELKKVQKIAIDIDTQLEVLELSPEMGAWQRLDWDFYWSETWGQ